MILNLTGNEVDNRSGAQLELGLTSADYVAGETVSVAVKASNFREISGYQFTIETGLELVDVLSGALNVSTENFATVEGAITTSWHSAEAMTIGEDEVLFTMELKASSAGTVSEGIAITSTLTAAEAYQGSDYEVIGVSLRGDEAAEYSLYQNEPNPFALSTRIGFTLPSASEATLTVYDVTGKVISVKQGSFDAGYNEFEITKSELSASGVMYYQLESGEYVASKKMIIIE